MGALPQNVREMRRVYLQQGEVLVTHESLVVQTTLGSCVAVVIHDPVTKLAGMCHAVMPEACGPQDQSLRYVDRAVPHLLARFARNGVPSERLQIKVIGGSTTASRQQQSPRYTPIGPRNVDVALSQLSRYGVRVAAQDTGGAKGRRLLFDTSSGTVFVHALVRRADDA